MDLHNRLSYLFGTEEHVEARRELIRFSEDLWNHWTNSSGKTSTMIYSGSASEGVSYPQSDEDVMMEINHCRVARTYTEATQRGDLLMVPLQYSPGFCLLYDVNGSFPRSVIHVISGQPSVSSTFFKLSLLDDKEVLGKFKEEEFFSKRKEDHKFDYTESRVLHNRSTFPLKQFIHGPCFLSDEVGLQFDQLVCFRCSFWPDVANDWINRNRSHGWPSHELVQNIIERGCHVVPIGNPLSPFYFHEWRLSFSVAERTLIQSFTHVQFLTYNLFKLIFRRIIDQRVPDVLCSYFIKTTILFVAEKLSKSFWHVGEFKNCIKVCLGMLYGFIDRRCCPNYFIPDNNMIRRKLNLKNRDILLELLVTLYNDGIAKILYLCGESRNEVENPSMLFPEIYHDLHFLGSNHLRLATTFFLIMIKKLSQKEFESYANIVHKVVKLLNDSNLEKLWGFFYTRGILFNCHVLIDHLCSFHEVNKRNKRLRRFIHSLLRIEYRGDLTSGKLTRATYMYLVGRTESSLSCTRRLLSELPPYSLDRSRGKHLAAYMECICNRGYTIDERAEFAWASPYNLDAQSLNAFPIPLRMWISIDKPISLHHLLYAYVLESLCHIRLQNHISLTKSTNRLVKHIDHLLGNDQIIHAKMCVGIIKYEQSDSQSACRWFGSIYIMKDTLSTCLETQLSAFTYIGCLLCRRYRVYA